MFLTNFETLAKQEIQQVVCDLSDQREALEDKVVRKQFASSISSKFGQLPDVSKDINKRWLQFRSAIISSAAESCGGKRLRVAGDSEKKNTFVEPRGSRSYSSKERYVKGLAYHHLICNSGTLRPKKQQL